MTRKKTILYILMILLLVVVASCKPAEQEAEEPAAEEQAAEEEVAEEPAEEPEAEEVTLTVWFLSGSPEEAAVMEEMSDVFAGKNPGVTIDFSTLGFDDMNTSLREGRRT